MFVVQYISTVYRSYKGLGFLAPKFHPENNLKFTLWYLGSIDYA